MTTDQSCTYGRTMTRSMEQIRASLPNEVDREHVENMAEMEAMQKKHYYDIEGLEMSL